jgi:hypothetical protein
MVGGELLVLSRGRVRDAGGVSADVDDRAGTIWTVDPDVAEPLGGPVGHAVQANGAVLAEPTEPPFRLWDRFSDPPERDRWTDRPHYTLRYHEPTQSLYLCSFSGLDLMRSSENPDGFSKNLSDAIIRYDLRTRQWSEVERHRVAAGDSYDPSAVGGPVYRVRIAD